MKTNRNGIRCFAATVVGIGVFVLAPLAEAIPYYGACCDEDGTCTYHVFENWPPESIPACSFQGLYTDCTSPKACCLPDDSCEDIDPICCDDLGGTPYPFATCAHWNCGPGFETPAEPDVTADESDPEAPVEAAQESTESDQEKARAATWALVLAASLVL